MTQTDQQGQPASTQGEGHEGEDKTILAFLSEVKNLFPIEDLRSYVRVTPRGIFIEQTQVDRVIEVYRLWLERFTNGEVTRTALKVKKRLFGGEEPPLQYLSEGKVSFSGFLIPCVVREPQKYQIPFFLGALTDTRSTLHSKDPIFAELADVEATQGPGGLEIRISQGPLVSTLSTQTLKDFGELAGNSPRMERDFPKLAHSLAETLRAFVTLYSRTRTPRKEVELFLPRRFIDAKRYQYRTVGSFVFILDKKSAIQQVLDLRGKSLYYLVRKEMSALLAAGTKRIGSFEIYGERHHFLGAYHLRGQEIRVTPGALTSFIEALADSPDKRDHFSGNFTVQQAFERFSTLYQTSQSIQPNLISSYINRERSKGMRFQVNASWIFAIGREGAVERTIAKHLGIRRDTGGSGQKGRGKGRGPRR